MAANLLKSGQPVYVWNRTPRPEQALAQQGATPAATPAECGIANVVFGRRRMCFFAKRPSS
jgi:3-hydroxyisobutyrate dehydrogenase-like beta-hydroxyacid dehydrogenase